jgi:hypothetical protein
MSGDLAVRLMSIVPVAYLVLQVAAIVVMRGRLRTLAKACAWTMGGVVAFALVGVFVADSNLAPIWIVFAAPILTLALLGLWLAQILRWLRS